jgi:pimeloyl-ACP methyl ester carboxylesterase
MPALIVWGDSDRVIPIQEGQYLNGLIPHAEFVTMQGVNHIPHVEDNDALVEVVLEFLKTLR